MLALDIAPQPDCHVGTNPEAERRYRFDEWIGLQPAVPDRSKRKPGIGLRGPSNTAAQVGVEDFRLAARRRLISVTSDSSGQRLGATY